MTPIAGLDVIFLFRYLFARPFNTYVEDKQWGQAYPAIKDKDLMNALFPLPPLAEQHRIVARVEALLAKVAELRKMSERKEALRKGVLRALVG